MGHAPLNDGITHHANAMRIRDHHRPFEKARFFHPGRAGHFAIAVERPPPGEDRIAHGIFSARKNRGDAGAHRTFSDLQLPFPKDERRVADGYSRNIGDGVERSRGAVEGNAKVAGARLRCRFFLGVQTYTET